MNKLLERKLINKSQRRKEKKITFLFLSIGLLSFISFVFMDRQSELTIIQFKYIIILYVTAGFLFGGLTYSYKKKYSDKSINIISHLFWSILIYGSITSSIFLYLNKEFANANDYVVKSKILERHETFRHSIKYVMIDIFGFTQEIKFPNNEMTEINNSNFVILTLTNGMFGFPVIKDKKLSLN